MKRIMFLLLVCVLAGTSQARFVFEDGLSHTVDYELNDNVFIEESFPAANPTSVLFDTGAVMIGIDSIRLILDISGYSSVPSIPGHACFLSHG